MSPLAAPDADFQAQTAALIAAWVENLAREEPSAQRVFADYARLEDAQARIAAWLRAPATAPAPPAELRALAQRLYACLDFATVERQRAARLRRSLFARRSRGCHAGQSALEAAILAALTARAAAE